MLPYLGYIASVVVLISFILKDIIWIRAVNFIGCVLFVLYGIFFLGDMATVFLNSSVGIIQVYYIATILNKKQNKEE